MKPTVSQAFRKCTWIFSLFLIAWAFIGPAGRLSAKTHREKSQPVITVGIYNYAAIGQPDLRQAESQSAALFAMAGVRIVWAEQPVKPAPAWSLADNPAADFSVRILRTSANKQAKQASGVDIMGESIIPTGVMGPTRGGIANIYYNLVKEVTSGWDLPTGVILGEAIAHELGHLMLGSQHSQRGIMKILWTSRDQDLVSHCELRFLSAQAVSLRRAAVSLHQDSAPVVSAQR